MRREVGARLRGVRPGRLAVTAAAVLLAGGAVAWATIPDGNGVIHGCYGGMVAAPVPT